MRLIDFIMIGIGSCSAWWNEQAVHESAIFLLSDDVTIKDSVQWGS